VRFTGSVKKPIEQYQRTAHRNYDHQGTEKDTGTGKQYFQ
jgi:hypothetical protein